MFGQALQMQELVYNTAVLTAAGTLLSAAMVFLVLYLILERKKKPLVAFFVMMMISFGALYWYMGKKVPSPLDVPKTVKTEAIRHYPMPPQFQPTPIPVPKGRPRVKKEAKPVGPPLKICP